MVGASAAGKHLPVRRLEEDSVYKEPLGDTAYLVRVYSQVAAATATVYVFVGFSWVVVLMDALSNRGRVGRLLLVIHVRAALYAAHVVEASAAVCKPAGGGVGGRGALYAV